MSASQGRVSDREYEVLVAAKLSDNEKGGWNLGDVLGSRANGGQGSVCPDRELPQGRGGVDGPSDLLFQRGSRSGSARVRTHSLEGPNKGGYKGDVPTLGP